MNKIQNVIDGSAHFSHMYPYTNLHEMNLDFLLTEYQNIVKELNETIDWANNHQGEYEEALARLEAVENEINTFEQRIEAEFSQLKADQEVAFAEQTAKLDAAIVQMEGEIDAKLVQFQTELDIKLAQFTNDFLQLKAQVEREINNLKAEINSMIIELRNSQQANNQFIFDYVENRLDQFIIDFPSLVDTPVYNPVRGSMTTLQRCINDLYDFARFYGLTAQQYDVLQLTAEEYDNYELTALDYDQRGYLLLGYPDENLYMRSPFTGQMAKISEVVTDLAHFHMDVLTAAEYDALELTAEEYDEKEITAFEYDWDGKDILTA